MEFAARGLYAILDVDTLERRGLRLEPAAEVLLAGGASVLQLRAKNSAAADLLRWLRILLPMTRRAGALLMGNDRADLAQLAGCDGVHVGQDDVPVVEVRRGFPDLRVGVSTHDLDQLVRALDDEPDYVALGPIFETRSKVNPDPTVGLEMLKRASELAAQAGVPLVAIGGITDASAASVRSAGAQPAVISALMPDSGHASDDAYEEIRRRTRAMVESGVGSGAA